MCIIMGFWLKWFPSDQAWRLYRSLNSQGKDMFAFKRIASFAYKVNVQIPGLFSGQGEGVENETGLRQ